MHTEKTVVVGINGIILEVTVSGFPPWDEFEDEGIRLSDCDSYIGNLFDGQPIYERIMEAVSMELRGVAV